MLKTHFLIADPHPLFTDALSSLLWQCGAHSVRRVVEYTEIIKLAKKQRGTVIIFNINTPGSKGAVGLVKMLGKVDAKSVIIMLERRDPVLENFCIECGVAAIVSKLHSLEQIRDVVESVMIGESINMPLINSLNQEDGERMQLYKQISALSPKETQVFEYVKEGHLNKQIAHELKISEATIKYHVGNILRKLDCQNRTQAAVIANKPALFS